MTNKQDISEDIQTNVTKDKGCQLKAEVTLGSLAAKKTEKETLKAVRKKVSLPGFRKGKAPEAMIRSHFGPQIEKEWRQRALSLALLSVMEKEKTRPLNERQITGDVTSLQPDEVSCSISFETAPDIPSLQVDQISVSPSPVEAISDERVEEELKNRREEEGTWETAEPKEIEKGDHVTLSIVALGDKDKEDDPEPRPVCEENRFHVEQSSMGQWMVDAILGKKPGDVIESVSEKDDSLPEDAPFIPTRYRITIDNIVTNTPLNDEELAEKYEKTTLEGAKQAVRKMLETRNEADAHHNLKLEISQWILQNYSFDIPHSVFENLRKTAIKRTIRMLKAKQSTDEEIKKESEEIEADVAKLCNERLTLFFLADRFFSEHDPKSLEITGDQLKSAYFREMLMPENGFSFIDKEMTPEESRMELIISIYSDRLLSHLASKIEG